MPRDERRMLRTAAVALPAIAIALRIVSLRRVLATLAWGTDAAVVAAGDEGRARRAADLVAIAARRGIHPGNCLSRSVTLWWLLRRRRIASELRIGVRKEGETLLAHAWVEQHGRPLNDSEAVCRRYAVFERNIVPAGTRWS